MHILSSGERVRQMRGSFTAGWCPHVMADRVVNRTEGVFGDGGLGLDSVDFMVSKKNRCVTLGINPRFRIRGKGVSAL